MGSAVKGPCGELGAAPTNSLCHGNTAAWHHCSEQLWACSQHGFKAVLPPRASVPRQHRALCELHTGPWMTWGFRAHPPLHGPCPRPHPHESKRSDYQRVTNTSSLPPAAQCLAPGTHQCPAAKACSVPGPRSGSRSDPIYLGRRMAPNQAWDPQQSHLSLWRSGSCGPAHLLLTVPSCPQHSRAPGCPGAHSSPA